MFVMVSNFMGQMSRAVLSSASVVGSPVPSRNRDSQLAVGGPWVPLEHTFFRNTEKTDSMAELSPLGPVPTMDQITSVGPILW